MGNWRDAFPSKWFNHKDLADGPRLLTIKTVSVEEIGDDKRPVVWFNEFEKPLGLNIINGQTIEDIAGTADPDEWEGTALVLFKTQTDYQGKRVDCVRIRKPKPGAQVPKPPEDDDVPF